MKNQKYIYLLVIGIIALVACDKEEDIVIPFDNSCSVSTLSYNVRFSGNSLSYMDWTSGICVFREIIYDGTLTGNTLPTSITHSVITTVELSDGTATPEIPSNTITPGTYINIYYSLELQDNGVDDNMILNATYTKSTGGTVPIQFLFNSGEVFEASLGSHVFEAGTNTTAWLELDPGGWFSVISRSDLDNGTINGDGIMVISDTSNTNIYDPIETQIDITTATNGTIVFQTN